MQTDQSVPVEPPELPRLVDIDCDTHGPVSVAVTPRWLELREPSAPLDHIQAAVRARRAHRPAAGWRAGLSVFDVPLDQLREFVALLREARAEQSAQPSPEPQRVASQHCTAIWIDGALSELSADEEWLRTAARQAISDEFVTVLTPPDPTDPRHPTVARRRMARFMQEIR